MLDEIRILAPAAFAEKPKDTVSEKQYTFIPTYQIIDDLQKLNWDLYGGQQQKSRLAGHELSAKHMLRFRHHDFTPQKVGDTIPEILIINAHDRTSSFRFYVGLYRLVCSNGLVVQGDRLDDLRIPHRIYTFEYVREQVNHMTAMVPEVLGRIEMFKRISLDEAAKMALAERSLATRFPEYTDRFGNVDVHQLHAEIDMQSFLTPKRVEDADSSLWSTFNLIQEKVLNGGFERETEKTKELQHKRFDRGQANAKTNRRVRRLSNIGKSIQVNQDMWKIATEFSMNR